MTQTADHIETIIALTAVAREFKERSAVTRNQRDHGQAQRVTTDTLASISHAFHLYAHPAEGTCLGNRADDAYAQLEILID